MHFVKKIGFTDWESRQLCDGAFVVVDQSAESLSALDRQAGVRQWRFGDGSVADGLVPAIRALPWPSLRDAFGR